MPHKEFVLTFSCADKMGLVSSVATWLVEHRCNIIDSDQFGDRHSNRFFMRVHFAGNSDKSTLDRNFAAIAQSNEMAWQIWPMDHKPNVLIMVSRQDHCLTDLLYRTRNNELPIHISLVASNHRDTYALAAAEDVDFMHLPVAADNKHSQEQKLLSEIDSRQIDFVVLARYMQILSSEFCAALPSRIINIHHSFLPSFKGAKPYHQAHDKGVKLIGATAHYVTTDLDEGPIIEQGIERVDHRDTPDTLAAVGRDIERIVLAKAVGYQAEHRILLNGNKTVVFQ